MPTPKPNKPMDGSEYDDGYDHEEDDDEDDRDDYEDEDVSTARIPA